MTCTAAFPCHHRLKRKACYSLFTEFPSLCVCIIAFRCAQSSSPGLFMCHMLMLQSSPERKPNAIWCNYYAVCFDCKIRHYICFIVYQIQTRKRMCVHMRFPLGGSWYRDRSNCHHAGTVGTVIHILFFRGTTADITDQNKCNFAFL